MHLECGHALEVSKPEAKQIKVEGWKTMKCEDCSKHSRILSVRVPKESAPPVDTRPPRRDRNYGRGRHQRS